MKQTFIGWQKTFGEDKSKKQTNKLEEIETIRLMKLKVR